MSSYIASLKWAPIPARRTFGDHAKIDLRDKKISVIPAAAALRNIDPRFPGS